MVVLTMECGAKVRVRGEEQMAIWGSPIAVAPISPTHTLRHYERTHKNYIGKEYIISV